MKKSRILIALTALTLLSVSCSSTHPGGESRTRFHEAAHASVVLKFDSWDYISMLQPIYREDGYLQYLNRDELGAAFDRFGIRRDLAVVVIGWNYELELPQLLADWKNVLAEHGFQRVVVVRANLKNQINGAVILDDSRLAAAASAENARL